MKKYFTYGIINIIILLDVFLLYIIKEIQYASILFGVFNIILLTSISIKLSKQQVFEIFIFMLLTFTYALEFLIHYLKCNIYIEFQYLNLIPLFILFIKTYINKGKKISKTFILMFLFFIFNFIISIAFERMELFYWLSSMIPYISFAMMYYVSKENDFKIKELCILLFVISIFLTTLQWRMGFSQDTRNGIFGVSGIGTLGIFSTSCCAYLYSRWLRKKENIFMLLIWLGCTILLLCLTENKAGIVLLFISFILIPFLAKKKSMKVIISIIIFIVMLPQAYMLMIKLNPKFSYLVTGEKMIDYFTGNNNRKAFRYGRYESLNIVYNNLSGFEKIAGTGIGSSTPQPKLFYIEANREPYTPYYISLYGYDHGFQLTGISTLILDGGLIFVIIVVITIIKFFRKIIIQLRANDENSFYSASIKLNAMIVFLFYLIYSNVFNTYKMLVIVAFIMGIKSGMLDNKKQ